MTEDLIKAIADLEEQKSLALVEKKIKAGEEPLTIVKECQSGVEIVGNRYSQGDYYLSDLIMSEEILRGVMEILTPYFSKKNNDGHEVNIVMGTIEGDIHDLGKNIIIYLLKSAGINVYDLGVDVKPEEFVRGLEETGASVLGISVLLTFCIGTVKKVIDLINETGLRDEVTIIIGGYPVNEEIREYTGADYFETNANQAIDLVENILKEGK